MQHSSMLENEMKDLAKEMFVKLKMHMHNFIEVDGRRYALVSVDRDSLYGESSNFNWLEAVTDDGIEYDILTANMSFTEYAMQIYKYAKMGCSFKLVFGKHYGTLKNDDDALVKLMVNSMLS